MPSPRRRPNEQQEDEICSVCECLPEDLLILTCKHNLCLECATEMFHVSKHQDRLVCEICLSETPLDGETVLCLRSLSARNYQTNVLQVRDAYCERQPISDGTNCGEQKETEYHFHENQQRICAKHHEAVVYFCFDCSTSSICSECMLEQNHVDHQIMTLKKAEARIVSYINEKVREKEAVKQQLLTQHTKLTLCREQSQKEHEANFQKLKMTFDTIYQAVSRQYETLRECLEEEATRKLEIIEGAINEVADKVNLLEETMEFESELLNQKVSQPRLFDYYQNEVMHPQKISFQPNIPSVLPRVESTSIDEKEYLMQQVLHAISKLSFSNNAKADLQELNYVSGIDHSGMDCNENIQGAQNFSHFQLDSQIDKKKRLKRTDPLNNLSTENINIISVAAKNHCKEAEIQETKMSRAPLNQVTKWNQLKGNEKVNEIYNRVKAKRQARPQLLGNDNDLARSRKMELSRSIIAANDIISKIQERSSRF